jgi:hypothetical protein
MNTRLIKKMVALGTGLVMVGATIFGASALTFADYPSAYTANPSQVALIVGDNAAGSDVQGMIGVANALSSLIAANTIASTSGTGTVSVTGGESKTLSEGDRDIYLNQTIAAQVTTITDADLPMVLKDGTFSDNNGEDFKFEQDIVVGTNSSLAPKFEFSTSGGDLDDPDVLLQGNDKTTSGNGAWYTLRVIFEKSVNFSNAASEGETIDLFGGRWTVGTATDTDTLVLFGSSTNVQFNPGEEKQVTLPDGTVANIRLHGVDTAGSVATISVNGKTDEITEGTTKAVGGIDIFADTISAFNTEADPGFVSLGIQGKEMALETGNEILIGSGRDALDGTRVTFTGTVVAGLDQIDVAIASQDKDFDHLKTGDSFIDPVFGTLKLTFAELINGPEFGSPVDNNANRKRIDLKIDDDNSFRISGQLDEGKSASLDLVHYDGANLTTKDNSGKVVHLLEGEILAEDEFFWLQQADEGHLYELTRFNCDDDNTSDDDVSFKNVVTSNSFSIDNKDLGNEADTTTKTIDGKTYTFYTAANCTGSGDKLRIRSSDFSFNTSNSTTLQHVAANATKRYVFPYWEPVAGKDFRIFLADRVDFALADARDGQQITFELPSGTLTATLANDTTDTVGTCVITYSGDATGTQSANASGTNTTVLTVGGLDYALTATTRTDGHACGGPIGGGGTDINISLANKSKDGELNTPAFVFREDEDNSLSDVRQFVIMPFVRTSGGFVQVDSTKFRMTAANTFTNIAFDDSKFKGWMDSWGSLFVTDGTDSDQKIAWLTYPQKQTAAKVVLSEVTATVSSVGSASSSGRNALPVSSSKLASEVIDDYRNGAAASPGWMGIVGGGPCANAVAAALQGNPADCTEGYTPGEAILKMYNHPDGTASILAAGYAWRETTRALIGVLAHPEDHRDALNTGGTELIVTGTDMTNIQVRKATAAPVAS